MAAPDKPEDAELRARLTRELDDGPRPSGLRYCINSAALDFAPKTTK